MLNHNHIKILFLTLIVVIAATNIIWYNQGHRPLHWDSSTHLTISLSFHDSVIEKRDDNGFIQTLLRVSWYYPPLVYYLSFPFFLITRNEFAGFLEITFFLLCLIFFVYLTGKKMFNESTGLFAAFCMAMYPIVINFSRDYMLDLPLASITAAGIFVLLKSDNYRNTLFSALAGITIGLGLLTKWTYILFILMPLIYFLYLGLKGNARKSKVILNFFLCLFLAAIVSLPWYLYNLVPILTSRTGELSRGNLNFVESALYYLKILPGQVSLLIIIFFIASIFLFRSRRKIFSNKFNIYWFVSAYILISLISYKMPRFSISLLIPFTLIFSDLIINSPNTRVKNIFIIIFGTAALTQYFLISFANLDNGYRIPVTETPLIENLKPNKTDWKNIEVIYVINDDRNLNGKERVNVRIIPDEEFFNALTFRYYAMERRLPVEISGLSGYPMFTDYIVIIKPPNEIPTNDKRMNISLALLSDTSESSKLFEEFRRIKMDDNEIIIFKPRIQKGFNLQTDVVREKIRESSESFLEKYIKPLKNYKNDIKFQDSISALKGKVSLMNISIEEALFGDFAFNEFGIKVKNFVLELRNLEISVPGLLQINKLYIISLDEINVNSFELDRQSLIDYIETSSKGNISVKNSSFGNNKIYLSGYSKELKTDFEIELSLSQKEDSNLYFKIENLKIFGISFPSFLVNYMLSRYNPLVRELNIIKSLHINKMHIINDKIIVGNNY